MSEFIDDPLVPVTQDNIEIDLFIGPRDAFDRGTVRGSDRDRVRPTDAAREYDIIEAEIELVDGKETNFMEAIVVGKDHNIVPTEGNPVEQETEPEIVTIDIKNQLTEAERDGQQIDRVFTGTVANAARLGDQRFKMTAFWPGFNKIQDSQIVISPPPALFFEIGQTNFFSRRNTISNIIDRAAREITRGTPFDYEINLDPDGVFVGTKPETDGDFTVIRNGFDEEVTRDSVLEPIETLLKDLKLKSESIWDVDRYGDFYFGATQPDAHKLRYITDTSAGKQSPAWRSVRVIGDGIVSQDGWGASAQINEDPETLIGNIDGSSVEDGLAEPTFEYRNMEINTRAEASHVLEELLEEIREQTGGGFVEVVGHPEVWPGDAIELPDAESQPFGLDRFGVKRVIHRINNRDGFMTRIECNGLTNGTKTLFEEDLQDIITEQKEYEKEQADKLEKTGNVQDAFI